MTTGRTPGVGWPRADDDIWFPTADEVRADPRRAAQDFVLAEAALLDAGDLERWLELFAPDAAYWVPLLWNSGTPADQLNLIYDDRRLLGDRVFRIRTGDAHAQDPPSRTVRVVAGIRGRPSRGPDEDWVSHATFSLVEVRKDRTHEYTGRVSHALRHTDDGLAIVRKRIDLAVSDQVLPNLTFLL